MIEAAHLSKRYGETLVVDDVSFRLPAGGVVAIIGPNGAGKSTVLSMISRLLPMDGGQASIDGLDVTRSDSRTLAKKLAVLRQDNSLAARLTVRDLVGFGRFPHSQGRLTQDDREKVEAAIAYLDLGDLSERFLDELSGGQRQRAFVAMVLAQDTDTVLLDEPLNNLDIRHAVAMMRLIRRAADELGRTIVVVLHDINFAAAYADRIIAMKNGRIEREGPVDDVISEAVISQIFGLSVAVRDVDGQRTCLFRR